MNTNFPIHRNNFEQIRDERRTAANTAFRIGNAFLSLLGLIEDSNSDIEEQFLHSQVEDVAEEKITFRKGLQVGNRFTSGLLGEGGIFRKEADGTTYLEADKLYIRIKAFFDNVEIRDFKHSAGNRIASPAGMKCCRVEWLDANGNVVQQADANLPQVVRFRCYFRGSDGEDEVRNNFIVGDQAYCHITSVDTKADDPNSKGLNMRHYWRLVVGRNPSATLTDDGEHWIDLSNQATETLTIDGHTYTHAGYQDGSDIPVAQDDIIQLGNIYDTDRMGAIIEFVTGADAPSYQIFQDINGFDLSGKNYLSLGYSTQTGHAYLNVYGDAYIGDPEGSTYIRYEQGDGTPQHRPSLRIKAHVEFLNSDQELDDLVQNHQRDDSYDDRAIRAMIAGLQDQIDGAIDTWFFNGTPGASVLPESDWKTKDEQSTPISYNERLKHLGDLYYDNQTGYAYRYVNSGSEQSPVFSWSPISDSAVVEALAAAARAQDTADHKRRIFLSTPYPPYDAGDMWVNAVWPASGTSQGSVYNDDILKCINPVPRTGVSAFSIDDWTKASKYTDDSKFNGYINALLNGSGASGDSATAAAVQRAIISAMGGSTVVSGGLMLTSMLALRKLNAGGDPTDLNDYTTWAGINGVYDDTKTTGGIAAWYGGGMKDYETLSAAEKAHGWNTERWAKSLFRFDGSGYVAGGNISWDSAGAVTIQGTTINATNLQKGGSSVLSQAEGDARYITVSFFETLFNAMNSSGQKVSANTTTGIASIKAMFGFWTQQYISALGQNSEGGGGGQGDVTWALLASTATGGRTINISYLSNVLSTLTGYSTSGGNYAVQKDANNHLYVNIPNVGTATNLAGGAAGSIPYQTAAGTTAFLAAGTSGQVLKINSSGLPYWTSDANTKNTAGTTNKVDEKMFLVGATTQAANPVTYSNVNVYIGTDNKLYSNGKVVLVTDDIYDWAKAASKPSYNFSEIDNTPTTLSGYGITDAKIASGVITLGSNTITPVTSVAMSVPTGFSVSGSPVTKTGTLALSYASGYEGFTTTLKNRINTLWEMFTREGSGTSSDPYVIKANYGLYTDSFLSALGLGSDSGGGGQGDVTWTLLADNNDTRQIALSHLTTALNGYATQSWVQQQGYTTNIGTVTQVKVGSTAYNPSNGVVSLPAYPTTLPASDVYAWAKATTKPSYNFSEINNKPTTLSGYGITDAYTKTESDGMYVMLRGYNTNIQSRATSESHYSLNSLTTAGVYAITNNNKAQYFDDRPVTTGTAFRVEVRQTRADASQYLLQRYQQSTSNDVYERYTTDTGATWTDWYLVQDTLANYASLSSVTTLQGYFTNGVANSAAKLTTVSKTAWGRTFWTANGVPDSISGDISNAGNITPSATASKNLGSDTLMFEYGYIRRINTQSGYNLRLGAAGVEYIQINASSGAVSISSAVSMSSTLGVTGATTLTGLLTANGGVVVPSSKTIKIGNAYLSYDSTNNAIRVSANADGTGAANFYAMGAVSALGQGTDGGGGGQGNVTWTLLASTATGGRTIDSSYISGTLSNYLPRSGGQMTGNLTWKNSTALPERSSVSYILSVDSFSNGGKTYWSSLATLKTSLGLGSLAYKSSLAASDIPSLAASKITSGTFDTARIPDLSGTYLPLSGGTMTGSITFPHATAAYNSQGVRWASGSKMGEDTNGGLGLYAQGNLYLRPATAGDNYTFGVVIGKNTFTYNGNTVWHEGNDGSGSGLDADLLDGLNSSDFCRKYSHTLEHGKTVKITFSTYYQTIVTGRGSNSTGNSIILVGTGYSTDYNYWRALYKGSTVSWCTQSDARGIEIKNTHTAGNLYITVLALYGTVTFTEADDLSGTAVTNVMAMAEGNVASATKLQTARTIWGQSFDGSGNVSGAITGATTISASSNVSVGGTLGVSGATTLSSTLSVTGATTLSSTLAVTGATTLTGLLTANGGITIPSGKTLTIGDAVLSWDATNQGIKITKGLYSQTFISALGAGSDSGGGGGQGDVTWTLLADNNDTRQVALSHLTTALGTLTGYSTSGTNYKVQKDSSNHLYVAVPWTNTTYTFATGDSNGQIKVTPSGGTAQNVSVKGLGSIAYKSSLEASDIPNLAASKITSGTFDTARIPDLSGTYLTLSGGTMTGGITMATTSSAFNTKGILFGTDGAAGRIGGSNSELAIYSAGSLYLRPNSASSSSGKGVVITSSTITYNGNTMYHAGNLSSLSAASGGTDVSLVTTGDKYTWNSLRVSKLTIADYTTNGANYTTFARVSSSSTSRYKDCIVLIGGGGYYYSNGNTGTWLVEMRSSNTGSVSMSVRCLIPPSTTSTIKFGYYTDSTAGITYFGIYSDHRRGEFNVTTLMNNSNLFTIEAGTPVTTAPEGWTEAGDTTYGNYRTFATNIGATDIGVVRTTTDSAGVYVKNSNGEVKLYASTNRGVYDTTNSKWLIATNGTNTWLDCGNVAIDSAANTSYKLYVNGTFRASGNSSIGGTLGVSGATTLSSTLSVSGNTTISGTLSLKSNAYSGNYCLNCNNSDIIGVNSIYTADTSDDWSEGINFKRSDGNWDTLTGNGEGDFTIYKDNGSAWAGLNCGMIWVYGPTNATMTTATTNPRVVFAERSSGTNKQRVGIVYTDYDTYRDGKGLKVMDVDGEDPNVWFEVAGNFISTGAVTALSDIRHKNIIKDVDVSVEQIAKMPAVVYQWNDRKDKEMHVGSIAQDWQRILPEVVMRDGNKEGTLSMQYGVAALVSSIITARKVVDHEKRIQELEKENKRLKEMLNVA